MADNYIEKQREQYEARKAAWERAKKYGRPVTGTTQQNKPAPSATEQKKRVFVTGGAEGIGRAIVEAFCRAGYRVAFCDRNETAGQQTAKDTGAVFYRADVSDKEALEHCMQRIFLVWGDIDILINNAGISEFSPITETSVEDFDKILSVNLRPAFITSRLLAIHRKSQSTANPFGRIINICSTRYLMSEPGSEGYAASKGGIYSLTHALALSLSEWHITVNSIAPGWIQNNHYEQLRPEDHTQHPSGRVGKPEDIARMCLFLSQEENDFINGEIDVLVSTTIIETGLDISNVNTMIIHDADNLGLSQLYQLRGRVGRSNRTAYAFLMYRRNKMLREVAEKRLHAIREFTDLGSGFKIAMRDLEIRGAGNLLGAEQHGHMEAVGYDLYCKMLNESVKELKGETQPEEEFDTVIDLDIDAFIPERYIKNEFQKLDVYKRIATIESEEEYDDMLEELMDRFGEPPKAVQNLLAVANLKAMAHRAWLTEIAQKGDQIRFTMFERAKADPAGIELLVKESKGKMKFVIDTNPYFIYMKPRKNGKDNEDVLTLVRSLTEKMIKNLVCDV